MAKDKGILKKTLIFMLIFSLLTMFFYGALAGIVYFFSEKFLDENLIFDQETISIKDLNWDKHKEFDLKALYLGKDGELIEAYNFSNPKEFYTSKDLMDFSVFNQGSDTLLVYEIQEGGYLYLFYPEEMISTTPTLNLNHALGDKEWTIITPILSLLGTYLLMIYLIVKRLSRNINDEINSMYLEEERRKDLLFRGLAHDIKTPLAGILGYSKAVNDGLVTGTRLQSYQEGIYRNALVLKDRVEDLKNLVDLGNESQFQARSGDILEAVRRYIGENYLWYSERQAEIIINFKDSETFITNFDKKLFNRLLQNIMENSVLHNEIGVSIRIDFDKNKRTLVFKDSGPGIPEDLLDTMFEPMVTGDDSRTGDKLRGMGLANVKRIADLHKWNISYKDGFYLTF